jgi:hypothetical protein
MTFIRSRKFVYILSALLGCAIAVYYLVQSVSVAKNSTAALGYLLIPFFGAIGAAIAVALVYLAFTAKDLLLKQERILSRKMFLSFAIILVFALLATAWKQREEALLIAKNQKATPQELGELDSRIILFGASEVREALAKHPNTPLSVLEKFARSSNDRLVSFVGANPSTPDALLDEIVQGPLSYTRLNGPSMNPKLSRQSMERLIAVEPSDFPGDLEYRLYQSYVLANLARQLGLPKDLYDRLAALAAMVIYSPHASCEQIARFLPNKDTGIANTAESEYKKRGCRS